VLSKLNFRGAVAILLVFYMGSGPVFSLSSGLGADGWIAQLIGFLLVLPLLFILARLVRLMPGMDFYGILGYTLGKWLAGVVTVLYFCYFITMAATVRLYYGTFLQLTSLPNTPLIVILLALFAICAYLAKSGAETLGKWSTLVGAMAIVGALFLALMAIPSMRLGNLLPVMASGGREILWSGYRFAVLPFGEAVVLLALFGRLERGVSPYRVFFFGALLAAVFFVLTFLRDAAVLGAESMDSLRYPSFQAASVIRMGVIEMRIESLWSVPLILIGATKAAVYLIAAVLAVRRLFGLVDGGAVLLPVAFFSVGLSGVLFYNLTALFSFPALHLVVAPLFQMGIPVVIWLVAEYRGCGRVVRAEE